MIIKMNLRQRPFDSIASGKKIVEMRLNDEKRQGIKQGDIIEFTSPKGKVLEVKVAAVNRFESFEELYRNYSKEALGYYEGEEVSPKDMLDYYTEEDIKKYGVVAIEIRL
ncbi:MAG: ASCH domain-containing protein [Candidatus Coproplasma sp.]